MRPASVALQMTPMEVSGSQVHAFDENTECFECGKSFQASDKVKVYPDGKAQHLDCPLSSFLTPVLAATVKAAKTLPPLTVSSQSALGDSGVKAKKKRQKKR